jgi:hypothetical protein
LQLLRVTISTIPQEENNVSQNESLAVVRHDHRRIRHDPVGVSTNARYSGSTGDATAATGTANATAATDGQGVGRRDPADEV